MADLDNVGRWAGEGRSRVPDRYPVLEFTELLCVAGALHPSGMKILRGELVLDQSGFRIATKCFSQDGSKSPRKIPKQAMEQKIKITRRALDKLQ